MPTPIKIATTFAGIALYLALVVLARGGPAAFFAIPALVALLVATIVAGIVSLFVGGNLSPGVREDRANRWVLPVFGVIGILAGILPPWADRDGIWLLDGTTTRWIGVTLYILGMAVRLWPVWVLGDRFSGLVAIQPGHTLVTTGIYRVVRNPSYVGLLVSTLGAGLAFRTWVGVLIALALLPPLIARIRSEERLLRDQFGPDYDAYRARTWRLLPWLY